MTKLKYIAMYRARTNRWVNAFVGRWCVDINRCKLTLENDDVPTEIEMVKIPIVESKYTKEKHEND